MRIEVLGVPFNGLGSPANIENPADGLAVEKKTAGFLFFEGFELSQRSGY